MKYFIIEGSPDCAFNATNKPREDVETILRREDIKPFHIYTVSGIQKNKLMKWKQFIDYKKNTRIWDKALKEFKEGDIVFIQYPILNTAWNVKKVIKKYNEKGIKFVAIIHDLDSLRLTKEEHGVFRYNRAVDEDKNLLNEMSYIICHNASMKKVLVDLGNDPKNIIELKLFDYLIDFEPKKFKRTKNDPFIIAGNLSPEKSKFISYLKNLNVSFNLFGVGYTDDIGGPNINYKGKFKPEELLNYLEGGFGLVWDGKSIDTIEGGFGSYLRYNNPYKVTLYLTAGIPVVVWKESALADYIVKNKLGFAVNNLHELEDIVKNTSDKEYEEISKNVKAISHKFINGEFLTEAIKKIK
jgi:hypothetical protein